MKTFKLYTKKKLFKSKKNPQIYFSKFVKQKFLKNNKIVPFFSQTNKINTLSNQHKQTVTSLMNIKIIQSLKNSIQFTYLGAINKNINTKSNYLLNFRNVLFTKEWNLIGSLCWSWFFDIYKDLDSKIDIHCQNSTLESSLDVTRAKIKYGKSYLNRTTHLLNFLDLKQIIKHNKLNIRKFIKIFLTFNLSNVSNIMRSSLSFNKMLFYKKIIKWKVKLKNQSLQYKNKKNTNPYLFLNNKELKIRKIQKYSYDMYLQSCLKKTIPFVKKSNKLLFFKRNSQQTTKIFKNNFFKKNNNNYFYANLPIPGLKKKLSSYKHTRNALSLTKIKYNRNKILKKIFINGQSNLYVSFLEKKFKNKVIKKRLFFNQEELLRKELTTDHSVDDKIEKYGKLTKCSTRLNLKFKLKLKKLLTSPELYKINKSELFKNKNQSVYQNFSKSKTTFVHTIKFKKLRSKKKKHKMLNSYILSNIPTIRIGADFISKFISNFKLLFRSNLNTGQVEKSFINYTYVKLNSRKNKPFVFRNVGVFLWSQKKQFFDKNTKSKFIFKKKLYSFLFPNEVRKAIMNRRKAFKSYRFIYKTSNFFKKKGYFSLVFFKNTYKNFFKLESLNNSLQTSNNKFCYKNYNNVMTREEIIYEEEFRNKGHIENLRSREIFIKRIRFKPGYQRIWRQAREAALEHFKIRTVYQQQLTKYLSKFYRQAHFNSFMYLETTLGRTIVYSRLLPDYPTVNLFNDKNFLFLNGKSLPDLNTQVVTNDFIQLIVSNWFYIYNRWITNTTLIRAQKFKRLIYRKGMAHKYKVIKLRKQKSRYTPKWVYYSRFDHSDIKTYFEVDYFTMSMFILYDPYILDYSAPDDTIDLRISIYKMYNWKYIT